MNIERYELHITGKTTGKTKVAEIELLNYKYEYVKKPICFSFIFSKIKVPFHKQRQGTQ